MTLHEPDERSGYRSFINYDNPLDRWKPAEMKAMLKWYWKELYKFKAEVREWSYGDGIEWLQPGDVRMVYDLRNPEEYESWVVTADSDYDQGTSRGEFNVTQNMTGMFTGVIHEDPIADGRTKAAGYCNLRAPLKFVRRNPRTIYMFGLLDLFHVHPEILSPGSAL